MLEQIPKRIRSLLNGNTTLRKKPKIKILISLGSNHTPVFMQTKNLNKNATRSFQSLPYIFRQSDQAQRASAFGKPLSRELLIRGVFELEFTDYLYQGLVKSHGGEVDFSDVVDEARKVLNEFSVSDIEKIYKEVEKGKTFKNATMEVFESLK